MHGRCPACSGSSRPYRAPALGDSGCRRVQRPRKQLRTCNDRRSKDNDDTYNDNDETPLARAGSREARSLLQLPRGLGAGVPDHHRSGAARRARVRALRARGSPAAIVGARECTDSVRAGRIRRARGDRTAAGNRAINPSRAGFAPWGTMKVRGRVYDVLGGLAMALLTRTPVLSPRDDLTQPRADGIRSVLERALTVRPYYAPPPPLPDKTLDACLAGDMRISGGAERLSLLYGRAEGWITAH